MMMGDRGRDRMRRRAATSGAVVIGTAVAGYLLLVRRWQLRWGATEEECDAALAGDDLIANPDLVATRAITVPVAADRVWPWIVQLGQGRGGFYSYDALENLVGCDIHSADRVVAEWRPSTDGVLGRRPARTSGPSSTLHRQVALAPHAADRSALMLWLLWPGRLPVRWVTSSTCH
jgi:hypothetical protein